MKPADLFYLLCFYLLLGGCASSFKPVRLPLQPTPFTTTPGQMALTVSIQEIADALRRKEGEESVQQIMRYVAEQFVYDDWQRNQQFSRPVEALFQSRILAGCSDYALVQLALLRAMGLTAQLVLTVEPDWMYQYQRGALMMPVGHTFIELRDETGWVLIDPSFFIIYRDYDPLDPVYPRGQRFVARTLDFWQMGLRGMADFHAIYHQAARWYQEKRLFVTERFQSKSEVIVNYPLLFTNSGRFFLKQKMPIVAKRLFDKALRMDPYFLPALLERSRLSIESGELELAFADYQAAAVYHASDRQVVRLKKELEQQLKITRRIKLEIKAMEVVTETRHSFFSD